MLEDATVMLLMANLLELVVPVVFWGDTATSVPQLVYNGKLDYLVFDYLSEITMSLLTAAKQKVPDMGYAPDFIHFALSPYLKEIHRQNIKVISNAGGVNPESCASALHQVAKKAGIDLKIAVVTGDDLMIQREEVGRSGVTDMLTGKPLPRSVHSMNAYLGASPICRALNKGADIVITGRCVDSAIVLGPLMHEFNWHANEFNKLAAGSLAGHLVECGAQATGGSFTDWHQVPDWDNIGFPIVECDGDGNFLVTKPPNTGGLVNVATVGEQMLYEIGDPQNYYLPDVICDFSKVKISPISDNVVLVTGAEGKPPTDQYKKRQTVGVKCMKELLCLEQHDTVSYQDLKAKINKRIRENGVRYGSHSNQFQRKRGELLTHELTRTQQRTLMGLLSGHTEYYDCATYLNGYRAVAVCPVIGPRAAEKARRSADSIILRCKKIFSKLGLDDFTDVYIQIIGTENAYGQNSSKIANKCREVALWFAVKHTQKNALEIFSREIAPAATGGAPGLTTLVGGRPKATPVLNLFSFLYNKTDVDVKVSVNSKDLEDVKTEQFSPDDVIAVSTSNIQPQALQRGDHTYRLEELAFTRSGDKADTANIGVIARHPAFLPYLREQLNIESVGIYFKHLFSDEPEKCTIESNILSIFINNLYHLTYRYDVPGINAMNFVLKNALGGGGVASLRADPQGKGLGQMLLDFELKNMPSIETLKESSNS
ncbi:hypothetical protein GQR58_028715 [Nymphon striatum]|nr:hypothetical protein GQR58_028715 [Nymphon striatum]